MGQRIEFKRRDGGLCGAYHADAGESRAAIILLQEWWGLNEQIMAQADRYALAGFHVLVPDLYHGRVAGDADEARHLMDHLDFVGATDQDIAAALDFLRARSDRVGITGFCMGGALTVAAAVRLQFDAAVCFYGLPAPEWIDPAALAIPFQGHFAERDTWITPAWVDAFVATMQAAGRQPEIYRYAADHAFCNERRSEVYDADLASLALARTQEFFRRHLFSS